MIALKELNLAEVLVGKRREKGITQDELAAHVGVSKASVSKWENGNSYPDITLLPVLATYFDISIDRLMNYSPQLSEEEITKTHAQLAANFASEPFEAVIAECEALVKKYYSCYPFLLYIVLLYINHAPMAESPARKGRILQSAIGLCKRVINNCRDANAVREATIYQAVCHLSIGESQEVLALLGEGAESPPLSGDSIIIQAHQMLGNTEKAIEVAQVDLYQALLELFEGLLAYIQLNLGNFEAAQTAFERAESLSELFHIRHLNANGVAILYFLGAHLYQAAGKSDETINMLGKYVDVCIHGFFPFAARGDSFFDRIDDWLDKNIKNRPMPRNEIVVKESMLNDVLLNPAFDSLHGSPAFADLIQKLRTFIGGN